MLSDVRQNNRFTYTFIMLYVMVLYIYFFQYLVREIPFLIYILGCSVIASLLFYLKLYKIKLVANIPVEIWIWLAFYVTSLIIGLVISKNFYSLINQWISSFSNFLLLTICSVLIKKGEITKVAYLMVTIALLASVFALINRVDYVNGRISYSRLVNVNELANIMLFGIVAIMVLLIIKKFNLFYILMGCMFIYIIFLTETRKALFGTIILLGVWFVLSYLPQRHIKEYKKRAIVIYCLLFLCVIILLLSYSIYYQTPLAGRVTSLIEEGGGKRAILIQLAIDLFYRSPIYGVGFNNFSSYNYMYGYYSHSNIYEIISCTGMIGFFLYYSVYFVINAKIIRFIKISKTENNITQLKFIYLILAIFLLMLSLDISTIHIYSINSIWSFSILIGYLSYLSEKYSTVKKDVYATSHMKREEIWI